MESRRSFDDRRVHLLSEESWRNILSFVLKDFTPESKEIESFLGADSNSRAYASAFCGALNIDPIEREILMVRLLTFLRVKEGYRKYEQGLPTHLFSVFVIELLTDLGVCPEKTGKVAAVFRQSVVGSRSRSVRIPRIKKEDLPGFAFPEARLAVIRYGLQVLLKVAQSGVIRTVSVKVDKV